ncbi:MAG TPA: SDR family oxidoreductase [Burkholderiales bacterium]|nr:SDR family oxidoreductase [Burkholderiales bacterium]
MRLSGESILVTGSTAGIGKHIALMCAREGARVAVHGRNRERGEAVVANIIKAGGQGVFLPADLSQERACADLIETAAQKLGGLTGLVNNAAADAIGERMLFADETSEHWNNVITGTLSSAAWLTRGALRHMLKAGRGSIVNVSSRQAERASPGFGAYAAAKGGMNALTRAVAVDYGKKAIRCNALSVGYVVNERRDAGMTEQRRAEVEAMHLTRPGQPDDIAYAAVFLLSREAEFITGTLIPVDGGASIARGKVLG